MRASQAKKINHVVVNLGYELPIIIPTNLQEGKSDIELNLMEFN